MSKTRIVTYVCWIFSALALIGLALWLFFANGFTFIGIDAGSFNYENRHVISVDEVENVNIDWISGRVNVGIHDGEDIIVTEFSRRELRERDRLSYNISNNTLTVEFNQGRGGRINSLSKQLEVLIPRSLQKVIDENFDHSLDIVTVSGRVNLDELILFDSINVRTTSGRIELANIEANNIRLQTTSGRVEMTGVISDDISAQTTSGRISALRVTANSLTTQTVTGRHELFGSFNYINARATSGRLDIGSSVVSSSVVARTTTGRIEVSVPNDGEPISVEHSITTGRFSSQIPIITHGGSSSQFNLTTTTGRISISEYRS